MAWWLLCLVFPFVPAYFCAVSIGIALSFFGGLESCFGFLCWLLYSFFGCPLRWLFTTLFLNSRYGIFNMKYRI